MRDRNGVWLNGASTIAALLYGDGDFAQTIRSAFNFGWDADNNAAASGAILGVVKGNERLSAQGWNIQDRFRNTSRDNMPADETITSFGNHLIDLARRNIAEHGGAEDRVDGRSVYRIAVERPTNVERLPDPKRQYDELRTVAERHRARDRCLLRVPDPRRTEPRRKSRRRWSDQASRQFEALVVRASLLDMRS